MTPLPSSKQNPDPTTDPKASGFKMSWTMFEDATLSYPQTVVLNMC